MERRDFLKLAGVTGLAVAGVPLVGRAFGYDLDWDRSPAHADGDIGGPLFILVQATGGWEPTLLCDPKGSTNNSYADGDILTAGNINYAPNGVEADTFFQNNFQRMCVINGVDVRSNNHDAGRAAMASGRLGDGHPNLAAVIAAHQAPEVPMSLLTFGGYESTGGLVAPTRDVDADRLAGIAYPDRINAENEGSPTYHSDYAQVAINLARQARLEKVHANTYLPKRAKSMDTLLTSRAGSEQLKRLEEVLPALQGNGQEQRVQLIMAAYKAGLCSAGNLSRGGFDTHGNHDASHSARLRELMSLVTFIWEEAERQEIADRLVVVMSSDFGRTPGYNGNNGKDHWPISSMIVMGEEGTGVPGNTVIGLTDEGHRPIPLDPATLQPSATEGEGVRIGCEHVHASIRKLFGVTGTDIDTMFPLPVETELDLFA